MSAISPGCGLASAAFTVLSRGVDWVSLHSNAGQCGDGGLPNEMPEVLLCVRVRFGRVHRGCVFSPAKLGADGVATLQLRGVLHQVARGVEHQRVSTGED